MMKRIPSLYEKNYTPPLKKRKENCKKIVYMYFLLVSKQERKAEKPLSETENLQKIVENPCFFAKKVV